jgi:hypothetical protein
MKSIPIYSLTLRQATPAYRRGTKCAFFIQIDDRSLEGECRLIGKEGEPPSIPTNGIYLLVWCVIEGENGDAGERVEYHPQVIHWRDGKAYRLESNATDFRIFLLTIKKNDRFRNRRHYLQLQLFINGNLYAESSPILLHFRPGKRLMAAETAARKGVEKRAMEIEKPNGKRVERWDVEQVVEEFSELFKKRKLSEDFSAKLREHNIQGAVLKMMKREDWKEVGIEKIGDLKVVERFVEQL